MSFQIKLIMKRVKKMRFFSFSKRSNVVLLILFFYALVTSTVSAQNSLGLQDAIKIALEKNYDVQVASLALSQSHLMNSAGEAGMLPAVQLSGGFNTNNLNLQQKLSDGRVINRDAATSSTYAANAGLTWTLFDGFGMFIRKKRLAGEEATSLLSLKLQMEASIQQVIAAYFAVNVEEENLKALSELLKVDSIRLMLADARLQSGNGSKLELLQAKLEQNVHIAQQLERNSALITQKENLNILLGRDPSTAFNTADTIQLTLTTVDEQSRTTDLRLRLAEQQKQTAFQWLKESKSARWPVLGFNANYAYNRTENEAGLLLRNENRGPGFGFSLGWNLFDGFRISRMIKNAELNLQIAETRLAEQITLRQQAEKKVQRDFNDRIELVKIEEVSRALAEENMAIALERLRSGLSNALEMQDAQRNYSDAVARLYAAKYNAKISEIELLRLKGELLK